MKKFRRALSLFTVAIIICSFLVGCAKTQTANESTGTMTSSIQPETTVVNTDEFTTIKAYFVGDKGTAYDETIKKVNEKLKTDVNASIDGYFIPWSDYFTKYPLIIASGENFDMIYTSNWCFYSQEATKGAFYELKDDMLKTYAPKTFEGVSKNQWDQTKIKGKTYMIPMSRKEFSKPVFLVRGDLMKKYGVNEIKTKDDMFKYWDAVAKNEKNMYPLALGPEGFGPDNFMGRVFTNSPYLGEKYFSNNYFQTFDLSDPSNIKEVDNSSYLLETYKTVENFRKKGYWTKNALTQQADSNSMLTDGRSATFIRQIDMVNATYIQTMRNHPEWEVQIVDIFPNIPAHANPATNNGMALSANTTQPERTLMVIDLFEFNKTYTDLVFYGVEGKHWQAIGDDYFKSLGDDSVGISMGFGGSLMRKAEGTAPNFDSIIEKLNKDEYTPILDFFNFDDSIVKTEVAAVNSVLSKYWPILDLGCADGVEETVTARNKELKKAGLEKIQAEYLKQAQEFCAGYNK